MDRGGWILWKLSTDVSKANATLRWKSWSRHYINCELLGVSWDCDVAGGAWSWIVIVKTDEHVGNHCGSMTAFRMEKNKNAKVGLLHFMHGDYHEGDQAAGVYIVDWKLLWCVELLLGSQGSNVLTVSLHIWCACPTANSRKAFISVKDLPEPVWWMTPSSTVFCSNLKFVIQWSEVKIDSISSLGQMDYVDLIIVGSKSAVKIIFFWTFKQASLNSWPLEFDLFCARLSLVLSIPCKSEQAELGRVCPFPRLPEVSCPQWRSILKLVR